MKMTVFWDVAQQRLVEAYRRYRSAYRLHYQGAVMMEAASTSETSVNFYQTTRRNIPEDSHLHARRREKLKSHIELHGSGHIVPAQLDKLFSAAAEPESSSH
jgi:hypothetical protein